MYKYNPKRDTCGGVRTSPWDARCVRRDGMSGTTWTTRWTSYRQWSTAHHGHRGRRLPSEQRTTVVDGRQSSWAVVCCTKDNPRS